MCVCTRKCNTLFLLCLYKLLLLFESDWWIINRITWFVSKNAYYVLQNWVANLRSRRVHEAHVYDCRCQSWHFFSLCLALSHDGNCLQNLNSGFSTFHPCFFILAVITLPSSLLLRRHPSRWRRLRVEWTHFIYWRWQPPRRLPFSLPLMKFVKSIFYNHQVVFYCAGILQESGAFEVNSLIFFVLAMTAFGVASTFSHQRWRKPCRVLSSTSRQDKFLHFCFAYNNWLAQLVQEIRSTVRATLYCIHWLYKDRWCAHSILRRWSAWSSRCSWLSKPFKLFHVPLTTFAQTNRSDDGTRTSRFNLDVLCV